MLLAFLLLALATIAAVREASGAIIHPGFDATVPHWNDTDGNRIESHAAGMLEHNGRWYWYGESKKDSNLADHGVNCYSAPTLAGPWKNEGQVIRQTSVPNPVNGQPGPFIIERPKVLFNEKTQKFVCWFHLDDPHYKFRHAAVFTADAPAGPFTFVHAMQPDGIPSLDMSLYKDPLDGQAYFIRSCDNAYAGFSRLSDDYLNSTGLISNHTRFEGMALFRHPNGTFYIITSHLTGWGPNPLMMFRAAGKTLDDPQWVDLGNPTGDPTSFNTQPTYVVPMTTAKNESYFMYMADNWIHGGSSGLVDASYVWLPIKFGDSGATLTKAYAWDTEDPFAPAPPPPPPPPCVVTGLGQLLRLSPCASNPADAMTWKPTPDGRLALGGFCAGASKGNRGLQLVACEDATSAIEFTFDAGMIKANGTRDGECWDAAWCGGSICAGNLLELWKCGDSTGHNEAFHLNDAGRIISGIAGAELCASVCQP